MECDGNYMIRIAEGMNREYQSRAVEMAAFLGFQSISHDFPVALRTKGIEVPESLEELCVYECRVPSNVIPETYIAASDYAKPIEQFDWRKKKGLESLVEIGVFLEDKNNDLLPDGWNFKLALPEPCDASCLIAACNFAFRFGMETTAYADNIVAQAGYQGIVFQVEESESCELAWEEVQGVPKVVLRGSGAELEDFSACICKLFPNLLEGHTWTSVLQDMTDSFAMSNPDGQLAYVQSLEDLHPACKAYVSPEMNIEALAEHFPNTEFVNYKGMKPVYERTYAIKWEVDEFRELLQKELYQQVKPGDVVELQAALSEEALLRRELEQEVITALEGKGAVVKEVQIICAYKQGYSWLEESYLPRVKRAIEKSDKKIKRLVVGFRSFLPEGVTDWGDVDGATPTYNNTSDEGKENWFDLPIRFLQELYPAKDLIKNALQLDDGQVVFEILHTASQETYCVTTYDQEDVSIMSDTYNIAVSERPYMDAFEGMGKVHPATGYAKIYINRERTLDTIIPTDVERIWKIYQEEVLQECKEFVMEKCGEKPQPHMQPFFSQLHLEITASEPDFKLPSRQDLYSSLDALHEDICFVGADYFRNLGLKNGGEMLDAPGLILPTIKKASGAPTFKVTLYDQEKKVPCIECGSEVIFATSSRQDIQVYLKGLSYDKGRLTAWIHTEGVDETLVKSYADLLKMGILEANQRLDGVAAVNLSASTSCYHAVLPCCVVEEKNLDIRDIDLMEYEVIGYEDYRRIIEELKKVPGLFVYQTATSYMGRAIYAVEVAPKERGYVSRTKRLTRYPSEIINARHHANEVSGTNAAFMIIKEILINPDVASTADRLNLVIVPMENVDGAAIHYELQKDNPSWKLHVARLNAVGKEFNYEYFKSDTIHTESMGFTRLWRKFLPDAVIDNHGVPSHEWAQPFSGYTAPSFKGFWLPRSLLYGYFWTVADEEFKSNYNVNKRMEDVIADAMNENLEMAGWNKAWMHQFETFAHAWMPKLFPAKYYKDMINYWIPFAQDCKHRYPSIRFPWITTIAYTSEVADETAQGEYLNLCARAHVKHDLAIMDMLAKSRCVYEEHTQYNENSISAICIRKRPIIATQTKEE